MVYKISSQIQSYKWGSASLLQSYFNIFSKEINISQVWYGAHKINSSSLNIDGKDITLYRHISKSPITALGKDIYKKYNDLPIMSKLCCLEQPSNIMVFSSAKQSEEGFVREDKLGIPLYVPERLFKDKNEKNTILVAITEFDILKGFRQMDEIKDNLVECGIGNFYDMNYSRMFEKMGAIDESLLKKVLDYSLNNKHKDMFNYIVKIHQKHGFNNIMLAPLYLNIVKLLPLTYTYINSGTIYMYLSGIAYELCANSDNIINLGLEHDKRDIEFFKDNISFSQDELIKPIIPKNYHYQSPFENFDLKLISVSTKGVVLENKTCSIITNVGKGYASIDNDIYLQPGESAFVENSTNKYNIYCDKDGTKIFIASVV